ncbi:MAG: hypothetical protein GEU73_10400 [Chloroflexi bacterium]|nr:hypothetical protein [Chloroflexota bacterium]
MTANENRGRFDLLRDLLARSPLASRQRKATASEEDRAFIHWLSTAAGTVIPEPRAESVRTGKARLLDALAHGEARDGRKRLSRLPGRGVAVALAAVVLIAASLTASAASGKLDLMEDIDEVLERLGIDPVPGPSSYQREMPESDPPAGADTRDLTEPGSPELPALAEDGDNALSDQQDEPTTLQGGSAEEQSTATEQIAVSIDETGPSIAPPRGQSGGKPSSSSSHPGGCGHQNMAIGRPETPAAQRRLAPAQGQTSPSGTGNGEGRPPAQRPDSIGAERGKGVPALPARPADDRANRDPFKRDSEPHGTDYLPDSEEVRRGADAEPSGHRGQEPPTAEEGRSRVLGERS